MASEPAWSRYDDGYLSVDLNRREVLVQGMITRLSAKEFDLLRFLLQNADRMLTCAQILASVWRDQHWDSEAYVHVYIHRLRQKLERDPTQPVYLLT